MLRIPYYTHGNWKLDLTHFEELESLIVKEDFYDPKGNLYTTYNKKFVDPFGSFYDERALAIASQQAFRNISKLKQYYWIQIYGKDAVHHKHTHFVKGEDAVISWVHFLKVPDTPCFRFTDGENHHVPQQETGDFLVFPSYVQHEVIPHQEDYKRIVVAGNILITEHNCNGL